MVRNIFYGIAFVFFMVIWSWGFFAFAYDSNYQTPVVWLSTVKQYAPYIDDTNLIICTNELDQDTKIPFMEYVRYISNCLERINANG